MPEGGRGVRRAVRRVAIAAAIGALGGLGWGGAPAAAEGVAVSGTVLGADGAPEAGARVELSPVVSNFAHNRLLLAGETGPAAVAAVESDGAGRFVLAAPGPGVWRVEVGGPGRVPVRYFPLPAVAPVELPPVAAAADAGLRIAVVDGAGRPVAGVQVVADPADAATWRGLSGGWSVAPRKGVTGPDGRLTLPRAAGERLALHAARPGALWGASAVSAAEDAEVVLTLAATGRGRLLEVRDAGGLPAAKALVVAGNPAWPLGLTDAAGRLSVLGGAGEGATGLMVFTSDGRRADGELPATGASGAEEGGSAPAAGVGLPPGRSIAGRVVDATTARPLAGALVWPGHDPGTFTLTGPDGTFAFPAPPYARFWLQAEAAGRLPVQGQLRAGRNGDWGPELVLVLPPASVAAGRVAAVDGSPLAGASVVAVAPAADPRPPAFRRDPAVSRATTGGDGGFSLAGLHPDGRYEVVASHPGFLAARVALVRPGRPGAAGTLRLTLEPARPGVGRVVDGEDRPLAGVEVRLAPSAPPGERPPPDAPVTAETVADGRFTVAALPGRRLDLAASRSGFAPTTVQGIAVPAGRGGVDLGTVVLLPGVAVSGRVVAAERGGGRPSEGAGTSDGRAPIAGARVWVAAAGGRLPGSASAVMRGEPAAVAGADGAFRIADLVPDRRIHLAVGAEGYLPALVSGVTPPTREPLRVELVRPARVAGVVVDGEGAPVAGATVTVGDRAPRPGVVGLPRRGETRQAVSDGEGRFEVAALTSGAVDVAAEAEGFQPAEPVALDLLPGAAAEGVRLVLQPGAELFGTVTAGEGEPVTGARVRVGPAVDTTGADGLYRVTGIPPGTHDAEVRHPDYNRLQRPLEIVPGTNHADFVLAGGHRVGGKVIDDRGEPVAAAEVTLRRRDPRDPRLYRATSDPGGAFTVAAVADGVYDLAGERSGYAPGESPEPVRVAGAPVAGLELVLRPGATVSGRLLGLDPVELPGAAVVAEAGSGGERAGSVDYEGRFEVTDLGPGDWLLRAHTAGGDRQAEARVAIAPDDRRVTRDLLFAGATLSGRISLASQPLAGAIVSVRGDDSAVDRGTASDYAGGFRLADLPAGRYHLFITHPREQVTHNQEVVVHGDTEVEIDLATERVSGTVVAAADGGPVGGVVVYLQLLGLDGMPGSVVNSVTGPEGGFTFARLTPGRYRLLVRHPGYLPFEGEVEVAPAAPVDGVEVRLEAAGGLELTLRLASGGLPPNAAVAALDGGGGVVAAEGQMLDAEGHARFASLPPGVWDLLVTAPGAVGATVHAELPGPPLALTLPDAARVRIRVPALALLNAFATAALVGPGGGVFRTLDLTGALVADWPLAGGSGVVDGVPPGIWLVRVTAEDGQVWERPAQLAAGVETLVVLE